MTWLLYSRTLRSVTLLAGAIWFAYASSRSGSP